MNDEIEYRKRLEKIADERTDAEREQSVGQARYFRHARECVCNLSEKSFFAKSVSSLIDALTPTDVLGRIACTKYPSDVRDSLIAYLELSKNFPYKMWSVIVDPDPSLPDEQNLRSSISSIKALDVEERERLDRDILDLLHVLGELANNANSTARPRIIALFNAWKKIMDDWSISVTTEMATQLVDELCDCWDCVITEVGFLPYGRQLEVWPSRPTHRTAYADEEHKDLAYTYYKRDLRAHLMPGEMEKYDTVQLIASVEKSMAELTYEMETGRVSLGDKSDAIDGPYLARILSFQMYYIFRIEQPSEENPGEMEVFYPGAYGPEHPVKEKLIASLKRYLENARRRAHICASRSYDLLGECLAILEKYNGNIIGRGKMAELAAARDLKIFISNLRKSRQILWADVANYVPPKPAEPVLAVVDGYTAQGKREAVMIANTKPRETDYFSDANLRILFEVSENTPYNWRTGKTTAPEGFAEAFEKKDYAAMQKCAERYKANRGKADAMNTKGVVRNISDEQMRKMGAKTPNGYCGDPQ